MGTRLDREKDTVRKMIELYCKSQHSTKGELCQDCKILSDYAMNRLDHCKYGESKPTCAKCPVHCYNALMRNKIKEVMRYSGPRMMYTHPIAAIRHLIDGRTKNR